MSGNPHLYLITKALRTRSAMNATAQMAMAVRGGGGHFHRPDPKVANPYEHTRLV